MQTTQDSNPTVAPSDPKATRLFWLLWTAIGVVYLWRLGIIPIHATADECRRALVPLEMIIRGDWLTPTINGEIYLNKPPLYSWLVAGSYALFGEVTPFAARFPVVVSILMTGIIIFFTVRQYTTASIGAITSLAFMTCWRTLTLDSMLSLVEHTQALLTYAAFALIYVLGERKRYWLLFLSTYALTALVFLIKGLPALMHQGIALLVYFVGTSQWRRLISPGHVAGIALMTGILALYYAPFFLRSDLPAMEVYGKLFGESTKRFEYDGPLDFILVLLDFPPDFIKHFLPWSLLASALLSRNVRRAVWADPFIRYNALLFAAIIPVYWAASFKSPHYFYFILPSFFTVAVYAWQQLPQASRAVRAMRWLVVIVLSLLAAAVLCLPFINDPLQSGDDFDILYLPVMVVIALVLALLAWRQYRHPQTLWYLAAGLIIIRILFNVYVMPKRIADQMTYPRLAGEIEAIVGDAPLAICASYPAGYYDPITFPLEASRREILPVVAAPPAHGYCLTDSQTYQRIGGEVLLRFPFVYMDNLERHTGEMLLVRVAPE